LGFPGDGFKDKDDANPTEVRESVVDGGDSQMNEEADGSDQITTKKRQNTTKKHKTSAPVPPYDFVVDRINTLNGSPLPCA
jgi:hypothetical protein